MTNLLDLRMHMTERRRVLLQDGSVGEIVRIDTSYPSNETVVSVWTGKGPGIVKVGLDAVVGPAPEAQTA